MKFRLALICGLAAPSLGGCYGLYGHDEGERYLQRADVITLSAGDAKEVNARAHMENPWPRYVSDRRIPAQGERMVGAIERYSGRPKQGQPGTPNTVVNVNVPPGSTATR